MGMKVGITLGRETRNGGVEHDLDCLHVRGGKLGRKSEWMEEQAVWIGVEKSG